MARRYHEIKGLAEFTAKTIVSDEREWKKFLHTAGHMFIVTDTTVPLFFFRFARKEGEDEHIY